MLEARHFRFSKWTPNPPKKIPNFHTKELVKRRKLFQFPVSSFQKKTPTKTFYSCLSFHTKLRWGTSSLITYIQFRGYLSSPPWFLLAKYSFQSLISAETQYTATAFVIGLLQQVYLLWNISDWRTRANKLLFFSYKCWLQDFRGFARWLETKDFSLARAGEPEPRAKDTLGRDRLFIHVAWVNRQLSGIIFQCCVTRSEWADDKHVFAQGKGIFFIFNLTTRIKRSFPVYQEREKSTSWQKWKKSLSPRKNKQQHQ